MKYGTQLYGHQQWNKDLKDDEEEQLLGLVSKDEHMKRVRSIVWSTGWIDVKTQ